MTFKNILIKDIEEKEEFEMLLNRIKERVGSLLTELFEIIKENNYKTVKETNYKNIIKLDNEEDIKISVFGSKSNFEILIYINNNIVSISGYTTDKKNLIIKNYQNNIKDIEISRILFNELEKL